MNANLKFTETKNEGCKSTIVLGFEPFFIDFVTVGYVNHEDKIIKPAFGYFAPHKYGKRLKAHAKKLNYTFNQ